LKPKKGRGFEGVSKESRKKDRIKDAPTMIRASELQGAIHRQVWQNLGFLAVSIKRILFIILGFTEG